MNSPRAGRRRFLKSTLTTAAGVAWASARPGDASASRGSSSAGPETQETSPPPAKAPRIRFAAIGLNHDHINGQVGSVIGGGGELVSFFAKEADLAAAFSKRFRQAKLVRSEKEILEDTKIQLVVSAAIASERAPLGIEVMRHGKDFMSDKPGMTTLEQLAEVRRVQAETRRIYSILYSERLENRATIKAGELVKAGAIGQVIQTIGVGPHRFRPPTRPALFFQRGRYRGIPCGNASHPVEPVPVFTRANP